MQKRERGILVTVLLSFILIGNFVGMFSMFVNDYAKEMNIPTIIGKDQSVFVTIISLLTVIFIVGTFLWKKWAIYGFLASTIVLNLYSIIAISHAIQDIIPAILSTIIVIFIAKSLLPKCNESA